MINPADVGGLAHGARLHVEGLRMLRRERRLWALALVPLLASLVLVGGTLVGVGSNAGALHAFVTGWLPVPEASSDASWLWVAPARVALAVVGGLLFVAATGAALVAAFLLANLVAAPFLDVLSRRVEAIATGRVVEEGATGLRAIVRDGARAIVEEAKRTSWFLAVQIGIAGVALLVPGGQLVAPPVGALVTMLFLPLDYASYALDRRRVRFRVKRRWVMSRTPLMLGYGATAFVLCIVPGVSFLAMPILVASGTLLALRHGPRAEGEAGSPPDTGGRQISSAR